MKNKVKKISILGRLSISLFLYYFDRLTKMSKPAVIVLTYHSIASDLWIHGVSFSMLKKQILVLKRHGFKFITLDTLSSILEGKIVPSRPSVVITFDDGYRNILQTKTFFKKLGIRPAVFLLSDTKHARRDELNNNEEFLTNKDIAALVKEGWTLGSHSGTHARLDKLQNKDAYQEVAMSKAALEKMLRKKIDYFAYPKGKYNNHILSLVRKAKYKLAFSMDDGIITKTTDTLRIPRIGINRSHTLSEFQTLWSPSVMQTRKVAKSILKNFV